MTNTATTAVIRPTGLPPLLLPDDREPDAAPAPAGGGVLRRAGCGDACRGAGRAAGRAAGRGSEAGAGTWAWWSGPLAARGWRCVWPAWPGLWPRPAVVACRVASNSVRGRDGSRPGPVRSGTG